MIRLLKLKIRLVFFFAALFAFTSNEAATYYFSQAGSDDNSGLSPAEAKRTLQAAIKLALPGNQLLFKRGDEWYNPSQSLDLRNKEGLETNYIVIDAYGSGPKPVIATLMFLDNNQWARSAGSGTWQQQVKNLQGAYRLFENGRSKYKVNTSDSTADEKQVDQVHEWYIKPMEDGSAIIYVHTGSNSTKPYNVELLPHGSQSALLMENTHYVKIRNIDFKGGSFSNVVHIEAPSSFITLEQCMVQRANGSGIHAENSAEGDLRPYVSHLNIIDCVVDKVWSREENDPAILLRGDGIFLRHAVDGGWIKGNKVLNWGHSGISITSYALGVHGVHNLVVEQNNISCGNSEYSHAIDMNGFDGLTTHNIIRRNYFHDYTVTGHILGSYNQVYSNIFAGIRITKMPRHSHQPWGVDWGVWQYRNTGPWIEAHHNILVNNTFADIEKYAVMVGDVPANPNPVRNNIIANNIFYNVGETAVNVGSGVTGDIFVEHNVFGISDTIIPVIRYKNKDVKNNYTAHQLNTDFPQYCSGNVQALPVFINAAGRDFRLADHCPDIIKFGGTAKYQALLGKGFVDYYGNEWDARRPSIGAVQYGKDHLAFGQERMIKELGKYSFQLTQKGILFDAVHGDLTDTILYDRENDNFNFDNLYKVSANTDSFYFRFGWQSFENGRTELQNLRWVNGRQPEPGTYFIKAVEIPFQQFGKKRVCTIGDSQTWWSFAADLRKFLKEKNEDLVFVGSRTDINGYPHEGEGGNNTEQVLKRLKYIPEADCYTLLLGTNDWKKPVADTKENIIKIITYLLDKYPHAHINYLTPLPTANKERDVFNTRLKEMVTAYLKQVDRVRVIPVGEEMRKNKDWLKTYMTSDGLHANTAGVAFIAGIMAAGID